MNALEYVRRQADATLPHARSCNKPIDSCIVCRRTVAFYASLPLPTLALVLQDRPAFKPSH